MTTATRARKTPRATTKPAFDREAMLVERDEALNEALHEAAELSALKEALQRVLKANVQLHLQRSLARVFDKFELKFEDRSCRADAVGTLYLSLTLHPDLTAAPGPWLSERDLFEGLPEFNRFGPGYSVSLLKPEHSKVEGCFDLRLDARTDAVRFVMLELTLAQMVSAAQAWRTTREALVAQEQARVTRGTSAEAKAFKALADLEAQHAALAQQLAELEEQLDEARRVAHGVKEAMARKVSAATPPLLQHLNALRSLMGLKPA